MMPHGRGDNNYLWYAQLNQSGASYIGQASPHEGEVGTPERRRAYKDK